MTFVNLCTLSGHTFFCATFREIISNGIKVMDTNDEPLTDGQTDTQNVGGYNIIPRHFFVAGHKKKAKQKKSRCSFADAADAL